MEAVRKAETVPRTGANRSDALGANGVDLSRANKRAALYKAAWVYR